MADMHEIDYKIFGDDLQFVEVELDPNEATVAEAGGMMYMDDGIEMETIFGDGSQAGAEWWIPRRADGRRQAAAHRRVAVHDRLPQPQQPETPARVRRPLSGQDRPHPSRRDRWRADRAEGLVPGGGERRLDRHRVSAQARRRAVRRRRLHHAAAAGRRMGIRPRRRNAPRAHARARRSSSAWIPAASSRSSRRSTTTSSSSARSSPRCSAARACSLRR